MKVPNSSTSPSITCIRDRFDFVGATLAASGARTRLGDASRVDADPRSQANNFECAKPIPFFTYYTTVNEGEGSQGTTVNESMVGGIFKAKHNESGQARENIVKDSSNRIVHSQQDT